MMIGQTLRNLLICASCLFLANGAYAAADTSADPIVAAIGSSERPAEDRSQDAWRQPATILAFFGVKPGWRVADIFSGGGYYTELLSRIVGPQGEVIAYNNAPYAKFAAKDMAARYAGNRLSNVRQITAEVDELTLAPGSLDGAIFVMSYHDMYWRTADGAWNRTDPKVMLSKLHAALKDDGVVVVQDHVATPGGDTAGIVDKLHRIDPAVVRRDLEAAGFRLDGESAALAHEADDHTKLVFDPVIRGKTDQFIYRFRKIAR
jgi:predicted methyltransferase